jgi:hypothetical protein
MSKQSTPQAWTSPLALTLAETSDMTVLHPVTNAPLLRPDGAEQTVTLAGIDSPQFRRVLAERQAAALASEDEAEDDLRLELAVGCTLAWTVVGDTGEDLPCTPEAVREMYQRCGWLLRQADRYMADRQQYLGEG